MIFLGITLYLFAIEYIVSFFFTNIIPLIGILSFNPVDDLFNMIALFSDEKSPLTLSINCVVLQPLKIRKSRIILIKINRPQKNLYYQKVIKIQSLSLINGTKLTLPRSSHISSALFFFTIIFFSLCSEFETPTGATQIPLNLI